MQASSRWILVAALALGCGGGTSGPNPPPAPPPGPPAPPPPPPPPAPVATVTVSPSSATLVPQQGTLLTATLRDASGNTLTGRTIQWTSTATAVASVDATGAVTALTQGSATIIATSEGQSGNAAITVNHGGFVGPSGGQATGFSGNVTLIVPAGALAINTAITITQIANPTPDPKLVLGTAFDLGPSGTQFAQPVTIRIKYNPALVPAGANPSQFRLARLTGATWVQVPGSSVDILTQTVTGQTSSFSSYAIIEVLPPVATVTLTGSLRVKVGDAYTYTATARLADGTIVVRPVTWGILETAKATIDPNGVLVPIQTGIITILVTIDGVVWQGTTTAYDWDVVGGGTSIFLSLLADNQITNQFGTSEYAELVIGCSAGSFQIWVDTDHFVTASGLVAYSFDGGTIFTQTWIEFDGFSALGYPGSTNLLRKSFAQTHGDRAALRAGVQRVPWNRESDGIPGDRASRHSAAGACRVPQQQRDRLGYPGSRRAGRASGQAGTVAVRAGGIGAGGGGSGASGGAGSRVAPVPAAAGGAGGGAEAVTRHSRFFDAGLEIWVRPALYLDRACPSAGDLALPGHRDTDVLSRSPAASLSRLLWWLRRPDRNRKPRDSAGPVAPSRLGPDRRMG